MQPNADSLQTSRLEVPVEARYARVVRLTAANMATIAGLAVDEVDDVRMAAEEAFVYACATGVPDRVRVDFTIGRDCLLMDFRLGPNKVSQADTSAPLVYAAYILEAMCDECVITDGEGATMHLVKRSGVADAL